MTASTILLVDDDEVLTQILGRVLTRQGHRVLLAHNVAQAKELALQYRPQLGLLDFCLPDGNGFELACRLTEKAEKLPLILLTAFPFRLRDQPQLAAKFNRVLTKPVNLQELREAIDTALNDPTTVAPSASGSLPPNDYTQPPQEPAMSVIAPALPLTEPSTARTAVRGRWFGVALAFVAVIVCVGVAGAAWQAGLYRSLPWFATDKPVNTVVEPGDDPVKAVTGKPNAIELSEAVLKQQKIGTFAVKPAAAHRPLELAGSLSLDPDTSSHLRSRFGGELIEIASMKELGADGRTMSRSLRVGDVVAEGDLLAVVWSADFGQKKSDLVDALSQLAADEAFLKKYESHPEIFPEFSIIQARRNAEGSRLAAQRAENSLRTAKMTNEEIEALKTELTALGKPTASVERGKLKDWARVEIRAPIAGTIVERNTNRGDIVDTATDLFKIADMRRLLVLANVREEDLPALQALKQPQCLVKLANDPYAKPLTSKIFNISAIIDPTQHTALAKCYVDNPKGELRGAQFVTLNIELPPPENTVAIPTAALVEDGGTSIVFVKPDPNKNQYVMKRVAVAKRFADVVHIRNDLTVDEVRPLEEKGQGLQTLEPNEQVVIQNVIGLKAALEDVQSKKEEAPAKK